MMKNLLLAKDVIVNVVPVNLAPVIVQVVPIEAK